MRRLIASWVKRVPSLTPLSRIDIIRRHRIISTQNNKKMYRKLTVVVSVFVLSLLMRAPVLAQKQHMKSTEGHMKRAETMPPLSALKPAEGAWVRIISPKAGEEFKGDEVPIQFKYFLGTKGHHIHAYVDGELMGMFQSKKGTLTGIQPGDHVMEVRMVADDHVTELDATDKVRFTVK